MWNIHAVLKLFGGGDGKRTNHMLLYLAQTDHSAAACPAKQQHGGKADCTPPSGTVRRVPPCLANSPYAWEPTFQTHGSLAACR
eukprot:366226-Chlamydomonas_euryale.AAC.28